MSARLSLRTLVTARLTAAAEDICALFESTIAEYEEKLRLSEVEKEARRKRQRQDQEEDVHPGILEIVSLNQDVPKTGEILQEPEKQEVEPEEEQRPMPVLYPIAVNVNTGKSSLLQQMQVDHQKDKTNRDVATESKGHTDSQHQEPLFSYWTAPIEAEDLTEIFQTGDVSTETQNSETLRTSKPETNASAEMESEVKDGDRVNVGHTSGRQEDEDKKHKCSVCQKRFWNGKRLRIHMRLHTGERPYGCSACTESFHRKSSLEKHMTTHTEQQRYRCSHCNKRFSATWYVEFHTWQHFGKTPFSCLICNEAFTVKTELKNHMTTHTGDKPYSCSVCKRAFLKQTNLKLHIRRTHTERLPLICSLCCTAFITRESLDQHTHLHFNKAPYICLMCEEVFPESSDLRKHVEVHRGPNPYICRVCKRRFRELAGLKGHMTGAGHTQGYDA